MRASRILTFTLLGFCAVALVWAIGIPTGSAQPSYAPHKGEPVLIELFTSQGCSSCPPADRLAARLAKEDYLVVISRPVDYWDRLGWKDTFGKAENTALQHSYASRGLGGYNGVYTPQIVVAGSLGEVGSDERAVRGFVNRIGSKPAAAIRVRGSSENGFAIGVAGTTDRSAELMLIGVSTEEKIDIGRGENQGRSLTYTNVHILERRISNWSGGKASYVLTPSQLSMAGADRYALVLRVPSGGKVLAASWLE